MIDKIMRAHAGNLKEVSGVERVLGHPRVPTDVAGWTEILGADINCILLSYDLVKPNFEVTSSYGDSTWHDLRIKARLLLEYKDSEYYEKSSQFTFDTILDNILDKYSIHVTMFTIDGVKKIRTGTIDEIVIPDGGLIQSQELGKLVHVADWTQTLTYIF